MKNILVCLIVGLSSLAMANMETTTVLSEKYSVVNELHKTQHRAGSLKAGYLAFNEEEIYLEVQFNKKPCLSGKKCMQAMPSVLQVSLLVQSVEKGMCGTVYTASLTQNSRTTELVVTDYRGRKCRLAVPAGIKVEYSTSDEGSSEVTTSVFYFNSENHESDQEQEEAQDPELAYTCDQADGVPDNAYSLNIYFLGGDKYQADLNQSTFAGLVHKGVFPLEKRPDLGRIGGPLLLEGKAISVSINRTSTPRPDDSRAGSLVFNKTGKEIELDCSRN